MRKSSYASVFSFILALILPFLLMGQSDLAFDFFHKKLADFQQDHTLDKYYIETDKSIYQEGDNVWFRVIKLHVESSLSATAKNDFSLCLFKDKGNVIPSIHLKLNEGFEAGNFSLPSSMTPGIYQFGIKGKDDTEIVSWPYFIIVKKSLVPDFIINCSYSDKKYGAGDEIEMSIKFHDYYFEPLKNVSYNLKILDGKKIVFSSEGKSSKSGLVKESLTIPKQLENDLLKIVVEAACQK